MCGMLARLHQSDNTAEVEDLVEAFDAYFELDEVHLPTLNSIRGVFMPQETR